MSVADYNKILFLSFLQTTAHSLREDIVDQFHMRLLFLLIATTTFSAFPVTLIVTILRFLLFALPFFITFPFAFAIWINPTLAVRIEALATKGVAHPATHHRHRSAGIRITFPTFADRSTGKGIALPSPRLQVYIFLFVFTLSFLLIIVFLILSGFCVKLIDIIYLFFFILLSHLAFTHALHAIRIIDPRWSALCHAKTIAVPSPVHRSESFLSTVKIFPPRLLWLWLKQWIIMRVPRILFMDIELGYRLLLVMLILPCFGMRPEQNTASTLLDDIFLLAPCVCKVSCDCFFFLVDLLLFLFLLPLLLDFLK